MSSTNASTHSPLVPINSNDHSGYIVFTIYGPLLVAFAFWTTRLAIRWWRLRPKLDDLFLVFALVLAIAQSICLQLCINAGLGKREGTSSKINLRRFEELYYAAQLMNILSQICSKTSVNLLFHQLQPFQSFATASIAAMAFSGAWAVASFLALAFQCNLPYPWKLGAGRCSDLRGLNTGIDIVNILSEVCIILLPTALMPKVQTTWTIRLLVIGCFAARVAVIAPLIGHIVTSNHLTNYADMTWAYITPTIWSQITMNVAIITACVPGMQQVLAELRPGMTTLTVTDAHEQPTSMTGSIFGTSNDRERSRAVPSKSVSIFGSRTDRALADCYKGDGKLWEMSRIGDTAKKRGSRRDKDQESESVKGLTDHDIVVTREVSCMVDDGKSASQG